LINYKNQVWEFSKKFEERPSKKKDLKKIMFLKEQVKEKDREMQKIISNTEYYRLELINRENNFNKIFNKLPQIGVMNPLKITQKAKKTNSRKKTPFREILK
jgi:hypothetical protein